jgi:hypothetical protein
MRVPLTSLFAVLVMALVLAAPAFAQTATQDGYSGVAGQVQAQVDEESSAPVAVTATDSGGGGGGGSTASTASTGSTGSLPFTGLDVALLAGAGLLLAGAGLGMRRLTRAPGGSHA